ncbi:hypothetical protein H5410_058243 [Solanum commersonii]|uniref:Uncharacterized protein n=1 Tax=Solanum commersonii TaxID=4109 RepID=A0A9J5WS33_SOLCO|nr:hypothetical protein H5410_058243 [Solanum commersonii]
MSDTIASLRSVVVAAEYTCSFVLTFAFCTSVVQVLRPVLALVYQDFELFFASNGWTTITVWVLSNFPSQDAYRRLWLRSKTKKLKRREY